MNTLAPHKWQDHFLLLLFHFSSRSKNIFWDLVETIKISSEGGGTVCFFSMKDCEEDFRSAIWEISKTPQWDLGLPNKKIKSKNCLHLLCLF